MRIVPLQTGDSTVVQKLRDLCQAILDQPGYAKMKESILQFLGNEQARGQYQRLCDLQDMLHEKSHMGEEVTEKEIAEFERLEQEFMANPLAQDFIRAQQQMQKTEQQISQYVRKTFELGRVPSEEDISADEGGGCCGGGGGGGCGCHG